MLDEATDGAVFLLNSPFGPGDVWDELPRTMQEELIRKHIRLYVIDADRVAIEAGMPGRINTIMQTCFFAISGVLPRDEAIAQIKDAIQSTYARKGKELVESNFAAVDRTLENLHEVVLPAAATSTREPMALVPAHAPRVRQAGDGHDDRRARQRVASQRIPCGRHLPVGDRPMGEAEHLRQRPGLEAGAVHPVRKLRDGVPARDDSRALLRRSMAGQRARRLRVRALGRPRVSQPALHAPGGRGGLHRLRALRRGVPRAKPGGGRDPRHQHGSEGTGPRARTQEPRVLRHAPRQQARGAGCGAGARARRT